MNGPPWDRKNSYSNTRARGWSTQFVNMTTMSQQTSKQRKTPYVNIYMLLPRMNTENANSPHPLTQTESK